jgi:hypothetical protein
MLLMFWTSSECRENGLSDEGYQGAGNNTIRGRWPIYE